MSEQRWTPVEDDYKVNTLVTWNDDIGEGDGTPDWWIAIERVATQLPDNIRLCRLTDAATVAVPVEVKATMREALVKRRDKIEDMIDTFRPYVHDNDLSRFRDGITDIDAALAWLEQAGGDNGD